MVITRLYWILLVFFEVYRVFSRMKGGMDENEELERGEATWSWSLTSFFFWGFVSFRWLSAILISLLPSFGPARDPGLVGHTALSPRYASSDPFQISFLRLSFFFFHFKHFFNTSSCPYRFLDCIHFICSFELCFFNVRLFLSSFLLIR